MRFAISLHYPRNGRFKSVDFPNGQVRPDPTVLRLALPLKNNLDSLDFELYVKEQIENYIKDRLGPLIYESVGIEVRHQHELVGYDGKYRIDITVKFRAAGVLDTVYLFECKQQKRPIGRPHFESLHSKLRSVGAQKAAMVSTSGFSGPAIKYAKIHGIAAICIAMESHFAQVVVWWPFH